MSKNHKQELPYLGFGLGLRTDHYQWITEHWPQIDWFEVISENYMVPGGKPLYYLQSIREHYPMVLHGVSMSIGSTDPLDFDYLSQLKKLIGLVNPTWVSDHLCWTGVHGRNMHDLLPLPYTDEAINHVVDRVKQVQDYLQRPILLENVSSYVSYKASQMTEWEFLTEIVNRADCYILLDINNIYVSAYNHSFAAMDYINAVPINRVKQFHLAGHQNNGEHIVDTHDNKIISEVWQLYENSVRRFGKISTMIERDDNIPEFPELLAELEQAKTLTKTVLGREIA